MKIRRVIENLSELSSRDVVPRGIIDEGRIFGLGVMENDLHIHGRVTEVVEGLREHVGQPFGLHPWAYVLGISTFNQTGDRSPYTVLGLVWPQTDGSLIVREFFVTSKDLRPRSQFLFRHTDEGTTLTVKALDGGDVVGEDRVATATYPIAIAVLNTRGCSIDLKRAPKIVNAKRKRQGKSPIPAHYDVDASEYFTALGSTAAAESRGGTHASPIPHLRRAHERVLQSGKRIWIPSALINVRSEGDVAFVERRKAYQRRDKQEEL